MFKKASIRILAVAFLAAAGAVAAHGGAALASPAPCGGTGLGGFISTGGYNGFLAPAPQGPVNQCEPDPNRTGGAPTATPTASPPQPTPTVRPSSPTPTTGGGGTNPTPPPTVTPGTGGGGGTNPPSVGTTPTATVRPPTVPSAGTGTRHEDSGISLESTGFALMLAGFIVFAGASAWVVKRRR
ncbi:MAG: hypothetical protein IT302_11460 [Dehalococcoidia bacterium]|nr:hypothetical protein [Dehalococcoidia bacterium]